MYRRAQEIKSEKYIGENVLIRGWIHRIRKQKDKTFILLRDDRGGIVACVVPGNSCSELTVQSSIIIAGIVFKDERAKEGGFEIRGEVIKVFNIAQPDFPIGEYQSPELLLDNRHLTMRTRKMISVAKIRSSVLEASRKWLIDNDWVEVTPPSIVKSAVEGGSTLFSIKYFEEEAYLSQSAQLYLEALIFALGPVWTIGPSFRAEKSRTIRHLAEYLHLEAEAPWVEMEDLLKSQEKMISHIVRQIVKERRDDLEILHSNISDLGLVNEPFERIRYESAIGILQRKEVKIEVNGVNRTIEWGDDLTLESERQLTRDLVNPVFITDFPLQVKPFYVKQNPQNNEEGLSADLLLPKGFGEVSSGGIREDNLDHLKRRIISEGLDPKDYSWYIDLRKYGSVPHGGFGLGIERLVRWITNLEDIKECVLFPRTKSRINP
jgi:asparaginyl-tRNA synthetase